MVGVLQGHLAVEENTQKIKRSQTVENGRARAAMMKAAVTSFSLRSMPSTPAIAFLTSRMLAPAATCRTHPRRILGKSQIRVLIKGVEMALPTLLIPTRR